jgi:uncharacterized protein
MRSTFRCSLVLVCTAAVSACASMPHYNGRIEPVGFQNGDVRLAGILVTPAGAGPYPAIVFVHGSGPSTRDARAWKLHANAFNDRGFAVLVYDKRGSGQSTGALNKADYSDLARDAVAAVKYLRTRGDIVPQHVGLLGRSEGGWVAPIAANMLGDISFVIISSGAAVSPADQTLYALRSELTRRGAPDSVILAAADLRQRIWNYYRTVVNRPDSAYASERAGLVRELAAFSHWNATEMPTAIAGNDTSLLGPSMRNRFYDPLPALVALNAPLLAVLGERDVNVEPRTTAAVLERLRREQGKDFSVRIYPGVDHSLFVWKRIPPGYVSGYLNFIAGWAYGRFQR